MAKQRAQFADDFSKLSLVSKTFKQFAYICKLRAQERVKRQTADSVFATRVYKKVWDAWCVFRLER